MRLPSKSQLSELELIQPIFSPQIQPRILSEAPAIILSEKNKTEPTIRATIITLNIEKYLILLPIILLHFSPPQKRGELRGGCSYSSNLSFNVKNNLKTERNFSNS